MKRSAAKDTHVSDTRCSLSEEVRRSVIERLNLHLATLTDLYSQSKHAHWNVRGREFYQLHKLFDEVAGLAEAHIDPLAERITALGGIARGTVRMAAASSALDEFPTDQHGEDLGYVWALADRTARAGNDLRSGIDATADAGDQVTSDLLTGIVHDLDKALYFLEAHGRRVDA